MPWRTNSGATRSSTVNVVSATRRRRAGVRRRRRSRRSGNRAGPGPIISALAGGDPASPVRTSRADASASRQTACWRDSRGFSEACCQGPEDHSGRAGVSSAAIRDPRPAYFGHRVRKVVEYHPAWPRRGNLSAPSPYGPPACLRAATRASTRPAALASVATAWTWRPALRASDAVAGPMHTTTGGLGRCEARRR